MNVKGKNQGQIVNQVNGGNPTDGVLQKTEIGTFIARNMVLVVAVVVLIMLGVVANGFYTTYKESLYQKYSDKVHEFHKENWVPFSTGKLSGGEYLTKWESLAKEVDYYRGLFQISLDSYDEFVKKDQKDLAFKLIKTIDEKFAHMNHFMSFYILSRKAALFEDLGQTDDAIKSLEAIKSLSIKVLEGKTYLDLGRLYLKKGNKDKARVELQHVVDHYPEAEFAKLARIYLTELK